MAIIARLVLPEVKETGVEVETSVSGEDLLMVTVCS